MTWPGLWMVGGLQTGSLFERWFRWSGGVFVCCALEVKKPREHDYDFFFLADYSSSSQGLIRKVDSSFQVTFPYYITSYQTCQSHNYSLSSNPTFSTYIKLKASKIGDERQVRKKEKEDDFI